jgi:glycolate dehydrogenase FAD-binding subunit
MTTTLDAAALSRALQDRIPSLDVRDGTPEHAIDGLQPALIVSPSSQTDVAAVLGIASEAGAAVAPRGGGTQTALGGAPERYDIALDLTGLDALVENEPADLTVTVEAGMRLSELQRRLGAHGQWLPLDPSLPDEATIGGILAANASGPARIRYGSARDLVIGMTVALANGDLVKSGGRVVKNVAGYDMAKLHIGALGTLGVITQASFKVAPLPVDESFVAIDGELEKLTTLAADVIEARLPLLGLVLTKQASAADWTLAVRTGGGEAAVERSQHEIGRLAVAAGLTDAPITASVWRLATHLSGEVVARVTASTTQLRELADEIKTANGEICALPGIGVATAAWASTPDAKTLAALRTHCNAVGGALILERAPVELKREAGVWGATRGDFALMQRLKHEFDPNRVLNPGRFIGGI